MDQTPAEYAKEIVIEFYSLITGMEVSYISKLIYLPSGDSNYETSKKCAKLSVNKILNELETDLIDHQKCYSFFEEVLIEIDKL